MTDHLRIREGDALYELHVDLCNQAMTLKPWQADERLLFIDAVRQLLRAVPDPHQRMAWSLKLAMACTLGMQLHGIPGEFNVAQLWERE